MIIIFIVFLILFLLLFIFCAFAISGEQSRKEEYNIKLFKKNRGGD